MIFIYVPKGAIEQITCPGIVLHEISHRFVCDLYKIPVYHVNYFSLDSESSGKVIHEKTHKLSQAFFIGMAPFFINSFIAMLLTIPYRICLGSMSLRNPSSNIFINILYIVISWVGVTAGMHAIPSNQDLKGLKNFAHTKISKFFITILISCVAIFNIPTIGLLLRFIYTIILMLVTGALLFGNI